jgi:sugar phosphate isomerase/epimerase
LSIALNFNAAADARSNKQFKFISDVEGFVTFAKLCAAPNVGIVVDSWNWSVGNGTLESLSGLTADKFLLVRIANTPENFDAANSGHEHRLFPTKDESVPQVALLKKLYEMGYRGPVTIYPSPAAMSGKTRDAALSGTAEMLDEMFAAAEIPVLPKKANSQPAMAGR